MSKPTSSNQITRTEDVIAASRLPDSSHVIQLKTILVPVDFSQEAFRVLDYAILVAKQFGAEVHPVHVRPQTEASAIERAGRMMGNYRDHISFLVDRLLDIEHKHGLKFPPDHCHIRSGRPFAEICKLAREIDADLVILGSSGHSGLKRVLLGSTAERVIRFAPCAVLVPRGQRYKTVIGLTGRTGFKVRNILVPTDFSNCSTAGVEYAVFLAEKFKAKLELLYSMEEYVDFLAQNRTAGVLATLQQADRLTAQNRMKGFQRLHVPSTLACQTEILSGYPVDQICAQSRGREVDLLVISTHGRSGFEHALMGSVAEQVARYAECPVVTVPSRCYVVQ
jgi:nucleotide-binding universal stress UspA family protein